MGKYDMFFDSEINRIFKRMSESFFNTDGIFEAPKERLGSGSHWYGYSLTVDPNGTPVFREHGRSPNISGDAREPTVDTIVDEKNNTVKLIAEIPGVEKSDIQILVDDGVVDISASRDSKKYHAKAPVGFEIDEKSAQATYKNGILQILFKIVATPSTGTKVEVN